MTRRSDARSVSKKISAVGAVLALVAGAVVWGVGAAPAQGAAAPVQAADDDLTFTIGITNEVDSFNPFNGIEAESFEMWALMYDYMITYSDKDMSPEPGLAESWETSDDGLTWTFHIRTGVKWSDGEDLTAEDIAYTYSRIIDGGPEAATWRSYLKSVESAKAPDAETVVLTLEQPNAVLPLLPIPIVPEHIWKDVPEDDIKSYPNDPSDAPVVGSGAFRLVEGRAGGQTYEFERNPDYWQGEPSMEHVIYHVYLSPDALLNALTAGDVDFIEDIDALQVQNLEGQDNITAQMGISPAFNEFAFNVGSGSPPDSTEPVGDPNPAVMDKAFRFALNFAIDREQIIKQAYQGEGEPGTTIIPTAYEKWRWEPDDPDAFEYNPDRAKELLDEAGYTVGSDGFRTLPNGDPIGQLRLYARSDSETSQTSIALLQEFLTAVDIDSKVYSAESSRLTNIIIDGEFDIFEWGWYVEPDPNSMLAYLICDQRGVWNDAWWCNEEFDTLYDEQRGELDQDTRIEMVQRMQEIMYEDAPYLVTAYYGTGEAYRSDRWEGFVQQPNPGGVLLMQYGIANYLGIQPAGTADGNVTAGGSSGDNGIDGGQVIALGVCGVLLFAVGSLIGGWAGYRKATVDYRE